MRTIAITGAGGLVGFHLRAWLQALRADVRVVPIPTRALDDPAALEGLLRGCDTVVHLAYLIVGDDHDILRRNQEVAERLTASINAVGGRVHLLFASSTHIYRDTSYGESKRRSEAFFNRWSALHGHTVTNVVFPNIFGESGKPRHNSVVSTFSDALANGGAPHIIVDGQLDLLHAQSAARELIRLMDELRGGQVRIHGRPMRVGELAELLSAMAHGYRDLLIPDLSDPLHRDLFNTYRSYLFPSNYPAALSRRGDARGSLFEVVKTKNEGQAFFSTTKPGITRGNHFHLHKLERFCVLQGEAKIRLRKLFSSDVVEYDVSGSEPLVVDIPTLHTHNITNTGSSELLTLFWASEIFDPRSPDTYPEPVDSKP